ncbi:glycosyltransferase [Planctomycetaceae bacterium SH139]
MLITASFFALALLAVWQLVLALIAVRAIFGEVIFGSQATRNREPAESWGRALVVLCLRGNDPLLVDALRGLMRQDYGDFYLRIVVDSEEDPAWQAIQASGVQQDKRVRLEVLRDPPSTCGLKNAALMQVLDDLEPDFKFLALTDADVITHPSWLRELIAPLRDSAVGLTTGIRWYHPQCCSLAALTRLVWNAAATTQMIGFQIPWGGSLAISLSSVVPASLQRLWQRGLCEDTMLTSHLESFGYRQVFAPSVIMINREDCRMGDLLRWIKRQLIVARLYHPSWKWTVCHGVASGLIPFAVLTISVWQTACGHHATAGQLAVGLLVYLIVMVVALLFGLMLMQLRLKSLGRDANWLSTTALLRLPLAVALLQFLYPVLLLQAMLAKTVDWRAMTYRIQLDNSVVHDGHHPYQTQATMSPLHSL